jgi:hypothetical protein
MAFVGLLRVLVAAFTQQRYFCRWAEDREEKRVQADRMQWLRGRYRSYDGTEGFVPPNKCDALLWDFMLR